MRTSLLALNKTRVSLLAAVFSLFLPLVGGCNPPEAETAASPGTAPSPAAGAEAGTGGTAAGTAAGKLIIEGSDTILPLAQKWQEEFKAKNPGATITVSGGGSGQGLKALINGTADIANASRPAKDSEKEEAKAKGFELYETAVARDGITIVVHPSNPVKSLTVEQVGKIYAGQINNWKEVGGPDQKIVTNGRETTSGTYGFFLEDVIQKLGKDTKYRSDMVSTPSNNKIAENVAAQPGGIGYIGVAYAAEFTGSGKVKEVPIAFKQGEEALLPTKETVLAGTYPISRALFNYTRNAPEGVVKAYLDYVTSADGQKIVENEGYIPLK